MISADDPKGKGKMKVLTSDRAKKSGAVDPDRQVTSEEMQQQVRFQNSRNERGGTSKPRVTSRILLNKWQREQEREYYEKQRFMKEHQRYEEEIY